MSKSGKKTKRAKGIPLQEFMSEGKPRNSSQVTKVVQSWADAVEEEECRPPQTFSLPTAPRASRVFDYVPENPPFVAYLSKLPYDANREDIEEFFSELHISDIKLPREDDSGKNRGFAYVEFAERDDLISAISLPDPTLMNRRFKIDLPNEEQGKRSSGRGRYDNFGSNVDETSTNWRKDNRNEDNDGGGIGRRGAGGSYGYNNRDRDRQQRDPSPETGNWREKQRPRSDSPPPMRRGAYQDRERDGNKDFRRDGDRDRDRGYPRRNNGYDDRNNKDAEEGAPRERPKLNLAPRTLPMPELKVAEEDDVKKPEEDEEKFEEEEVELPRPKPTPVPAATIFGSAKPVDTAAKEREIEERLERERLEKQKAREERERERSEKAATEESSEKETEVVTDNEANSWRRRDDRNPDELPSSPPSRRRYSPDRRGVRKFDDRRGGRDRDYDNRDNRDIRDNRENRDYHRRDNRDNRDTNRDHRNRDQRDQRGDRNRGDNYNRGDGYNRGSGGNRNDVTRPRDDKEKPSRRDKSTDDPKDIESRMPKYQAPVKPKLQMSNKYEDLVDEDASD